VSDDYIVFITETKYYQILMPFDSQEEADDYARDVDHDERDLEDVEVIRWAEAQ
jgi:hypothetical protein